MHQKLPPRIVRPLVVLVGGSIGRKYAQDWYESLGLESAPHANPHLSANPFKTLLKSVQIDHLLGAIHSTYRFRVVLLKSGLPLWRQVRENLDGHSTQQIEIPS